MPFLSLSGSIRINRNILECKAHSQSIMAGCTSCINRNILECKVLRDAADEKIEPVLIETYWNVKSEDRGLLFDAQLVLIETYWNVKIH